MKSTEVQTLGELRVWGTANGWAGPISMRLPAVCRYRTQLFQENRPFIYEAGVILKLLVSLMGRFVACSARISVDTHTDRQTNPRCACAPRVNELHMDGGSAHSVIL